MKRLVATGAALCVVVAGSARAGGDATWFGSVQGSQVVIRHDGLSLVVRGGETPEAGLAGTEPTLVPATNAIVAYAAPASVGPAQDVVGIARSDVDRVDVQLADGNDRRLVLNDWNAFAYSAADDGSEAVEAIAYVKGTPVTEIRLPLTAAARTAAPPVVDIAPATRTTQTLAPVDPETLAPIAGKKLTLPGHGADALALSPDGGDLALATDSPSRLLVVDLRAPKILRDRVVLTQSVRGLAWPEPARLIELRQTMGGKYDRDVKRRTVDVVDPFDGRVIGSYPLTNKLSLRGAFSTRDGLAVLMGSSSLRGSTVELAVATASGVRTVVLPVGVSHGVTNGTALAVDASSNRVYVVVKGGVVFDVDLTTMRVSRHTFTVPAPPRTPAAPFSHVEAHAFGGGIVVAGTDARQGVYLVDTASWTARAIDAQANTFTVSGDRLLTYGLVATQARSIAVPPFTGRGLAMYDTRGALVAHLYGARRFETVWTTPGFGHVLYGRSVATLDPKSGAVYFGPSKQLVFSLATGRSLADRPFRPVGALVFRGSPAVGEG